MLFRFTGFCLLLVSLGLVLLASADTPPATTASPKPDKPKSPAASTESSQTAARGRIEKALAQRATFTPFDGKLSQLIDRLQKKLGVPVYLDKKGFNEANLDLVTPMKFDLTGISGKSALNLMLRPLDLTWMIKDEALWITTFDKASERLETRVYLVTDMVRYEDDFNDATIDYDSVIDLVTSTINPETWDEVGGPGSIIEFSRGSRELLVINQTHAVHEQITQLFAKLRSQPAATAHERINKALSQKALFVPFAGTIDKLRDVLQEELKVPVYLDRKAFGEVGTHLAMKLKLDLSGVSCKSALNLLLGEVELAWTIGDESLWITTADQAADVLDTRVYPVTDLAYYEVEGGGEGTFSPPDFDTIIDLITQTVQPESWDEVGGPGSVKEFSIGDRYVLVISQTHEVHDQLAGLFAKLRAGQKTGVSRTLRRQRRSPWDTEHSVQPQKQSSITPNNPDRRAIVRGINLFGVQLHTRLAKESKNNICTSPYSIATVMSMALVGAKGQTADEIKKTLHLTLDDDRLHGAMSSLRETLTYGTDNRPYELTVANRFWGQTDFSFLPSYTLKLAEHYGCEPANVDFVGNPTGASRRINAWVKNQTSGRITDLVSSDMFNPLTRLVATNAIYFKADWQTPFGVSATETASFQTLAGEVDVSMMTRLGHMSYGETENMQVLELPYRGREMSMVLLLPHRERSSLSAVEKDLSIDRLDKWTAKLKRQTIEAYIPKFKFDSTFATLKTTLAEMGIEKAFDLVKADFSGMTSSKGMFLDFVIHKAHLEVDEKGTVAAAATVAGGSFGGGPQVKPKIPIFRADHPFLFFIRHNPTGTILFLGHVVDPSA